jgi:hypothetical protein
VLLSSDQQFYLLDLETLKPLQLPPQENQRQENLAGQHYWSGGTGRIFGATRANAGLPSGIASLLLQPERLTYRYEHDSAWFIIPGPVGDNIFVGGHDIKRADLTASPDGQGLPNSRGNIATTYMPAHHGPFFLRVHAGFNVGAEPEPGEPKVGVSVFLLGSRKPIAQLADVGVVPWAQAADLAPLGYPESIHLLPDAKLLIVIPWQRDRLLLHPLDLDEALEKSGLLYLFLTSAAPPSFQPGQKYQHQFKVKSKAGGVSFQLETQLAGMDLTPDGLLSWTPPADYRLPETPLVVRIRDAEGRQLLHSCILTNAQSPK